MPISLSGVTSVVFDLDGTLIDSIPDVRAALNRVLAEDGFQQLSLDQVHGMIGEGARKTIENALLACGATLSDERVDDVMQRYLAAYLDDPAGHTVVYKGVFEVLNILKDAGIVMGVCTNKPGATTRPVIDALGMSPFFSAIVTADDARYRKPDGRHLLQTLEEMGCKTEGAFFVGDSETDIDAANDADIPAICVTYGYCHVPFSELNVKALIDHFGALPEALV